MTDVIVRFTREGWHYWADAPSERAYLGFSHRHLFHVEVSVAVTGDNREIEFHDLLDFCKANFPEGDYGGQSCEMLARGLGEQITLQFPKRSVTVAVFEDGEVGARVTL